MMCVKAPLLVLCVFLIVHASAALPNPLSHAQKVKKLKFNKFAPHGRAMFGQRMAIKSTAEGFCKKNKPIKGGTNRADYKSSFHRALMQWTKSEDSRWAHLNVKDVDSSNFSEEEISDTDYQPPHRKPPIHNK